MPTEIVPWLIVGSLCGLVGYGLARIHFLSRARRLVADNNEIVLELESVKVTCSQLESVVENLELLQRSKNQFYSSTSHDLRQPLHALSMFSAVLQNQQLDDLSMEIVADISEAVFDITREIDVLLNIARVDIETLKLLPVDVDLAAETKRIVHQFQRLAKSKGLDLQVNTFTDDLVSLDRALFDRVLRNLIDNGIKFTAKGYVRVTIEYSKGNIIRLSVDDSGIGISKEDQESIYREYYQGRNLSGNYLSGVGLGLNSVLKLISRLGGEINVESTGLGGTSVSLEIPDVKWVGKAARSSEHYVAVSHSVLPAKTVLVLESDILVGKSTKLLLESAGYDVIPVSSLSEAYDIQRTQKVDSACLELAAGEDATIKLIEALRSDKSDMPIVVLSSHNVTRAKFSEPGISVLVKPVSSKLILEKLEMMC